MVGCFHMQGNSPRTVMTVFWSVASGAVATDAESSWVSSNPWLQPRSPDCTPSFSVTAALEKLASTVSYGSDVH
ncbi:hypothetical protein EYF80_010330 [Liparis tanakae]|uniref:Uncharacterized protein n=1 Tax=Liparis tanakae TaxID=230148 RepID=A0A4Z2IQS0_9TELE|nr:hypothetical protein EYF80_010330 [Liparis tanakae]